MRPRHHRGFTLVELMVVIAASSIVIAGAFALHTTFNRQNEHLQRVSEVQQTLRVARQYVERQLRNAGSGMGDSAKTGMKVPMMMNGTSCYDHLVGGVLVHNLNWPINTDPPTLDAGHLTEPDPDPDWFEFASVDVSANPATINRFTSGSGSSVEVVVDNIAALANVQDCTTMLSLGKPGGTLCNYALKKVQDSAGHINLSPQSCAGNPCMGTSSGTTIYKAPADCLCNPTVNPDFAAWLLTPAGSAAKKNGPDSACNQFAGGMPVMSIGPGLGAVRLTMPGEAVSGTPLLTLPFPALARAKLESTSYTWYPLTDLIEDLQLEVFLSTGEVVGSLNHRRDVTQAEWGQMRAIRYTLVAASRTPVERSFQQYLPQYADRPPCPRLDGTSGCPYSDGRVRRMVQGTVQLRNYGL
jgi:prepilin-type N-terminal cleavage/methylation domain-containing protein